MNSQDLRKDNKRRTDTNGGEERTHLDNGEDRSFAPNEDKLLCPLTAKSPEIRYICGFRGYLFAFWRQIGDKRQLKNNHKLFCE